MGARSDETEYGIFFALEVDEAEFGVCWGAASFRLEYVLGRPPQ